MERVKCSVRDVSAADRGMLVLLAEETLHPLADGSGHPERYHTTELLELLERADVFVAEAEGRMAGFVAVEAEDDALALRCVCVSPAFEARGVANQLVDWAEVVWYGNEGEVHAGLSPRPRAGASRGAPSRAARAPRPARSRGRGTDAGRDGRRRARRP